MSISVTVDLPEELAEALSSGGRELTRAALESLMVEAYRGHQLSDAQFRNGLGLSRWQADALLKEHGVWLDYTAEDFKQDGDGTRPILEQNLR